VEGLPPKMRKEATSSLRAGDIGALTILRNLPTSTREDGGDTPGPAHTLSGSLSE
jgi:hypothetical protein